MQFFKSFSKETPNVDNNQPKQNCNVLIKDSVFIDLGNKSEINMVGGGARLFFHPCSVVGRGTFTCSRLFNFYCR